MKLHCKPRRAAATLEFALTASILFMFLVATIEFGRLVMVQQFLETAARVGARKGVLATTTSATQIDTTVRDRLRSSHISSAVIDDPLKLVVSVSPSGSYTDFAAGTDIIVTVQVGTDNVTWLSMFVAGQTLTATASMQRE